MSILQNTKKFILDTLFPISCISCGCDDVWFCEKCLVDFKFLPNQVCPQCEKITTDQGQLCKSCKINSFGLDGLLIASNYKDNNIAKLVHLFKYNFIEDLHFPLGKILTKTILKNDLPLPNLIIPVPLHKRRLRFRGFNQAELLARHLSVNIAPGLEIPVISDLLIRTKYTPPQMKIKKYSARQENIRDAFEINTKKGHQASLWTPSVQNKNILLVDDVATTGATIFECAKILKKNGAKKVFGIALARQALK